MRTKPYKAIYAAAVAGLSTAIGVLGDGHLSVVEALGIAAAALVAGGGTYGITNPPVEP